MLLEFIRDVHSVLIIYWIHDSNNLPLHIFFAGRPGARPNVDVPVLIIEGVHYLFERDEADSKINNLYPLIQIQSFVKVLDDLGALMRKRPVIVVYREPNSN